MTWRCNMKIPKDISPIMRFEIEHIQECKWHPALGIFIRETIGVHCSLNPHEDSVRDKIYMRMEHWKYCSLSGEETKMRKQMYALICMYYKWYKETY